MHHPVPHSPCAPSLRHQLEPGYPDPALLSAPPRVYASVLTTGLPVGAEDQVQASVEGVDLSDSSCSRISP